MKCLDQKYLYHFFITLMSLKSKNLEIIEQILKSCFLKNRFISTFISQIVNLSTLRFFQITSSFMIENFKIKKISFVKF